MISFMYACVGAAVGASKALATASKSAAIELESFVDEAREEFASASAGRAKQLIRKVYFASGAVSGRMRTDSMAIAKLLAGLIAGGRYAVLSLWWQMTEDEMKRRLLLVESPLKYRLPKGSDLAIPAVMAPPSKSAWTSSTTEPHTTPRNNDDVVVVSADASASEQAHVNQLNEGNDAADQTDNAENGAIQSKDLRVKSAMRPVVESPRVIA